MIIINNKPVIRICKGNTEIVRVNRGNDLVYEAKDNIRNYQICEYIEAIATSSNVPYIDLGIVPENNERIEIQYTTVKITGENYFFGVYENSAYHHISVSYTSASYGCHLNPYWAYNGGTAARVGNTINLALYYKSGVKRYSLNGSEASYYDGRKFESTNLSYYLFATHRSSSVNTLRDGTDLKINSFKLYHNGNKDLVMDLIPVYRKSDGEVGMFDLVTNTFFGNQGTGAFEHGPEVYDFAA